MKYFIERDSGSLLIKTAFQIILLFFIFQGAIAQEPPPRPLRVTVNQNLSFGAFYQGPAGGTVTVNTDATRVATGSIVLLGMGFTFSPAIYRIVSTPGRVVSLLNSGAIPLAGSNGGSLTLNLGTSNPSFSIPNYCRASITLHRGDTNNWEPCG